MKLLVTGGSGLLGNKLVELTTKMGYSTYATYHSHPAPHGIPVEMDVSEHHDVEKVFEKIKPDTVVHAAAMTNVDGCEREKEKAYAINVKGTEHIVEAAEEYSSFLVYVSTDYVFDGEKGDYKESDTTNPINYYGQTKLEGEKIVTSSSLESAIARSSVIYGSTPAAGKDNFVLWVLKKLEKNENIKIINDQWVSPTLNTNLAEMILEILKRKYTGIFHLAGSTQINRLDFTREIADTFNLNEKQISETTSDEMNWVAKRPTNSTLNVEKAKKILENKPLELQDALTQLKRELSNLGG